jgi:hypothetical protein
MGSLGAFQPLDSGGLEPPTGICATVVNIAPQARLRKRFFARFHHFRLLNMKRPEPEFDQWTDQNHVPFCPGLTRQIQKNSIAHTVKFNVKLMWHCVLRLFRVTPASGSAKKF